MAQRSAPRCQDAPASESPSSRFEQCPNRHRESSRSTRQKLLAEAQRPNHSAKAVPFAAGRPGLPAQKNAAMACPWSRAFGTRTCLAAYHLYRGRVLVGARFKRGVDFCLITIEPITPQNIFLFKTVRLCALEDAPHAFSATYAEESQFADADWRQRAERMNGQRGAGFLAMDGDQACGMVGSLLDSSDGTRAQLVSMWTAPAHRHRGIGRLLVNEVLRWAHLRGVHTLLLMVTSNNEPAMRFYERLGFTRTGRTEPYPNDPGVIEYEMLRPVVAAEDP